MFRTTPEEVSVLISSFLVEKHLRLLLLLQSDQAAAFYPLF